MAAALSGDRLRSSASAASFVAVLVAVIVGAIVCVVGAGLSVSTALYWAALQPPRVTIGPPTLVQDLQFHIQEGAYIAVFGAVLMVGGVLVGRALGRGPQATSPGRSFRWRSAVLVAAVILVVAVPILGLVPAPRQTLAFGPSDFQLAPSAASGPYEIYLVSRAFPGVAAEDFFPNFDVVLRDNATGSVVARDSFVSSYVKAESAPYAIPQFALGFVAAETAPYVVVVRASFCESLGSPPCANATLEATGNVTVVAPLAYLPWQLGVGIAGSACVLAAVVQSGLGRRRATSA